MTRRGGVVTLVKEEAAPGREKEGDDASWTNVNFTGLKNKENSCGRFICYKWTVKI
jgi:hypothetical protein